MFRSITIFTISFLFILLGSVSANAQATTGPDDRETTFGVRGGLSLYTIETEASLGAFGSASETSGSKLGFAAGLFVEVPLTNIFSFQPELLFVQKGGSDDTDPFDDDDFFDDNGDGSLTFNYIDIPLLARANIPLDGDVTPYAVAGPSIGFLLSASASNGDDEDIDEFFKSTNIGFVLGAGVEFGNIVVDLRYDFGLTNIFDDSALESEFDDDLNGDFDDFFGDFDFTQKTSGLQLTVGIKF